MYVCKRYKRYEKTHAYEITEKLRTKINVKNFQLLKYWFSRSVTRLCSLFYVLIRDYWTVHVVRRAFVPTTITVTRVTWSTDEPRLPPQSQDRFVLSPPMRVSPTPRAHGFNIYVCKAVSFLEFDCPLNLQGGIKFGCRNVTRKRGIVFLCLTVWLFSATSISRTIKI